MSTTPLTAEEFKLALPEKVRKSVNQDLIDNVNKVLSEPEMFEVYRENLLSYTKVMQDGKYKMESYIHAVKYVSYKLMGSSNLEAYSKTFPDKMTYFAANGTSAKDISSYVSIYNKGQLVNAIFTQTMIPQWVLNQDLFQKALNVQADLMVNSPSDKVRSDAANSLLTHLKPPEVQKIELDIAVKEDSSIDALRKATMELVAQQRSQIASGMVSAQEIAHSRVIPKEVIDVESRDI